MWKKLLCVGATEDAPPPPSAGSASPPASAPTPKPSLPQLQLSQPLEAASITHPEQFTPSATAGTPPKITPTARPPPDSTAASSNRPSLPPLHYSPPIASVNLTPPTPIDAPSHPLLPRVPSSTTHLPPPPRQNPHSTHPSTASHRRSGSGSGSQSRSYKETLNAYAVDSGTGTRTVNQYRLGGNGTGDDGHLGKGSYATVERATDSETGVEYAIKEFSKRRLRQIAATEAARRARAAGGGARGRGRGRSRGGFSSISSREPPVEVDVDSQGPDNLDLIRTEVAIMKKVDHPNIASVHEVIDVTSDDALLIVLELCAGGPILRISQGETVEPMEESKARDVFQQLVLGVAYLHHNQIVHRDIKPDNCLFMADKSHVKLIDFGISKFTAKDGEGDKIDSKGSPAYMAPELLPAPASARGKEGELGGELEVGGAQHRQDLHGYACDMWSLGVTLYALVVGRLPFDDADPSELFRSIHETNPTIPSTLSPSLSTLLLRLLDKDSHTRITIHELWTDPWLTSSGTTPLPSYEENCVTFSEPTAAEVDRALNALRASTFLAMSVVAKLKGMRRRSFSSSRRSMSTASNSTEEETGASGGGRSGSATPPSTTRQIVASPVGSPLLMPTAFSTGTAAASADGGKKEEVERRGRRDVPMPERKDTLASIEGLDSEEGHKAQGEREQSPQPMMMSEPEDM